MISDNEVSGWWNSLSVSRRVATAKDLNLGFEKADWSREWNELASSRQREELLKALRNALPER